MPRVPRHQQLAGAVCFHVMDRGHNREAVFRDDEDRAAFLGLVLRYRARIGFRLHHYCLMDNHFHLLLRLDQASKLSALLAGLLRAYVHHCHRRYDFVGHRWQGRFKSPAVQDGSYLLSCGRYIERNPLAAGLVALPWEYAWSSARAYALGWADRMVDESPSYTELAATPGRRQELWRQFLLNADEREAEVQRGDWALGDADFRRQLSYLAGRAVPRRRGRPRKAEFPT
jgi:putative transposase